MGVEVYSDNRCSILVAARMPYPSARNDCSRDPGAGPFQKDEAFFLLISDDIPEASFVPLCGAIACNVEVPSVE